MTAPRPWPLLCLALLLAAFFGPSLAAGGLLATGDGLAYYLPMRAIAAASWQAFEWPFWNPYHFGGMPLLATLQGGVLYPGNAPFLWLAPGPAMNLSVVLAYALVGLTTYAYARAVSLPRAAAGLGAGIFMLSGYMVAHLEHLTMLQAAAWLPAMLWAVERRAETGRTRYTLALGLALALQLLAGYPQTTVTSLLVAVPYALWRAGSLPWSGRLRLVAGGLGAGLLGVGLACVQWGPAAALLGGSGRAHMTYADLTAMSLPPRQWLTMLFPFLFGAEPSALYPVPYWGAGPWVNEVTGYVGLVTLLLAAVSLAAWRASGLVRFWSVVVVVGGLLAMGGATPLYRLWAALPVVGLMRVPGRHLLEVDLALALLAALGFAWLTSPEAPGRERAVRIALGVLAVPMFAVVAGLALVGPALAARWQPFAPPGLDLATALSPTLPAFWLPLVTLVAAGASLLWLARRPGAGPAALVAALLLADLGLFGQFQGWRSLIPHPALALPAPALAELAGIRTLVLPGNDYPFHDFDGMRALRVPLLGALWGDRAINGYEPVLPARYARLVGGLSLGGALGDPAVVGPRHHALDLLGTGELRVAPALAAEPAWRARLAFPRWQRSRQAAGCVIFENARVQPLAWRPARAIALDPAQVDALVTSSDGFDPDRTALVEDVDQAPAASPGHVSLHRDGFGRITLATSAKEAGLVAVSEGYDAGWRASEGAREYPVHRVDGLIMGVEVPAGRHTVVLRYTPPRWDLATRVSEASALLFALWALAAWGFRRREAL